MTRPISALMIAISLAVCGCATRNQRVDATPAPTEDPRSDAAWNQFDTDHDGSLSMTELESQHMVALQQDLWNADSNGDSRISRSEWNVWWPQMTHTEEPPSLAVLNASSAR